MKKVMRKKQKKMLMQINKTNYMKNSSSLIINLEGK